MIDEKTERKPNYSLGLCVVGGIVAGIAGLGAALAASGHGDYVGAGICLAASALAFGLQANAGSRH